MLGLILAFSFLGSVLSLFGGVVLVLKKRAFTHAQSLLLISFAAGVLLATSFFDLLPEAVEKIQQIGQIWGWTLTGVVFLFLLEKLLIWYHHHDQEHTEQGFTAVMITTGDTLHNFIDGVVIAAATLVAPASGLVTALAVAAHEVPQEMADFGVVLSKGWSRRKALGINVLSACSSLLGALLTYLLGPVVAHLLPRILAFSAGMFIYLACSDLIPELHHEHGRRDIGHSLFQVLVFGIGIAVVWGLIKLLES